MRNWRAVVLASSGDGSTRRQASDAIRLGLALLIALVATLLIRADTRPDLDVGNFLTPGPYGVRWLVTSIWILGFLVIVVVAAALAVVTRNVPMIRDVASTVILSWLVCVGAGWLMGSTGGRSTSDLNTAISPGYPSVRIAVALGVVIIARPYLSRPIRRLMFISVAALAVSAAVHGAAYPLNIVASLALGYCGAAATKLIFGSPTGMPSVADVLDALGDLGLAVTSVAPRLAQNWGVAGFEGTLDDGRRVDISIYGRDASEAQFIAKAWRGLWYHDSGPTLQFSRLQQIEHEAYLMMCASNAGARSGEVVSIGYGGPSNDALLVTTPPPGTPLGTIDGSHVDDAALDAVFAALVRLRSARIAHGAISARTIVIDDNDTVGLWDYRLASSVAPDERLASDLANALVALALVVGDDRSAAAAVRTFDTATLTEALLHLQTNSLCELNARLIKGRKGFLEGLRTTVAAAIGIDVPELAKIRRVSWSQVLLWVGTAIGMWALLGVFINVASSFSTLKGAAWGWVAVVFVISLFPPVVLAWSLVASLFEGVPLFQTTLLMESQTFTGMIGSAVASMAVEIRFFQRRGRDLAFATTTTVLASSASWIVKGALFLIAVPLAWGNFHFNFNTSSHAGLVNVVIIVVIVVLVLIGLIVALPKIRRFAWSKIKPQALKAVQPMKNLAAEPKKMVALLAGNAGAQLLTALALGASLHAFGEHLSLASLIVIITVASMLGGVSPVPGGIGIVEAGLIAGFVAAGIPENIAVATVFVQRLFTAYLPPLWGWLSLVYLERHELI